MLTAESSAGTAYDSYLSFCRHITTMKGPSTDFPQYTYDNDKPDNDSKWVTSLMVQCTVQHSILQCFGKMRKQNVRAAFQIGDRPGDPQYPVIGADA